MSTGNASLTYRQFAEFCRVVISVLTNVVQTMTPAAVQDWIENPKGLEKALREALLSLKTAGFTDFTRVVKMRKGITVQDLIAECKTLFPVYSYVNLDGITSERTTAEDYEIRVRDRVEADEELKNLSANQLWDKGVQAITLEERLQLELDYFLETGQHLDIQNVTLCAGSRGAGGGVPGVFWGGVGLRVSGWSPDGRDGSLRARAVIS